MHSPGDDQTKSKINQQPRKRTELTQNDNEKDTIVKAME
jgi:hypothetical protein